MSSSTTSGKLDRAESPPYAGEARHPEATHSRDERRRTRRGRLIALAIFLICAAPVLASYYTYYVLRPDGRTNYGTLMAPFPQVGSLAGSGLDEAPVGLDELRGRWIMVTGADAVCDAACERRLYLIRQVRLTTGKERDRVERAWIIPSDAVPPPALLAEHEGLVVIRAARGAMQEAGFVAPDGRPQDHIWIIDPLGKLVLRYPVAPDPSRMKKDLLKLLKASSIG